MMKSYAYDAVGNRTSAGNATGSISHNANNELLNYGEFEFLYDANGNMIQKKLGAVAVNYVYNADNRLIQVEDDLTGTVIAEYSYNPFDRRLWKDVAGTRTYFFYSDEGLIAEYDENGVELKSYGYRPDSTWTTDPLFLTQNGSYYFYQNDHLVTPQKLVAQNGAVVWSATYSAFGEATVQIETVTNNLKFPGQYYDAETGLHYNYHRYYDPALGRYIQADPIGTQGGLNLYAYADNNPLTRHDVYGLFACPSSGCCGPDVSQSVRDTLQEVRERYFDQQIDEQGYACTQIIGLDGYTHGIPTTMQQLEALLNTISIGLADGAWDLTAFHAIGGGVGKLPTEIEDIGWGGRCFQWNRRARMWPNALI